MSSPRSFMKQTIVPSGAMTSTSTITSQALPLITFSGCSFQPIWTGTPTGTFYIYVSNDYVPAANGSQINPQNSGTWSLLPGALIQTNPSGSAGNTFIPVFSSCGYW